MTVVVVSIVSVGIYAWPGTQKQIQQGFTPIDVSPWVILGDGFRILDGYELPRVIDYGGNEIEVFDDTLEENALLIDSARIITRGSFRGLGSGIIMLDKNRGLRVIASGETGTTLWPVGLHNDVLVVLLKGRSPYPNDMAIFRITGDWDGGGAAVGEWARHE